MSIRVSSVAPVACKQLPADFKQAVAMLRRPYIVISKAEHDEIARKALIANTDVVTYKGRQMTFGEADDGYALMPLKTDL